VFLLFGAAPDGAAAPGATLLFPFVVGAGEPAVFPRSATLFGGMIIFGNVDAADSVPVPVAEKKTENGVWLATG
jgi:hypothetical protein